MLVATTFTMRIMIKFIYGMVCSDLLWYECYGMLQLQFDGVTIFNKYISNFW